MTPKKVWAVILIVLGVGFVINGFILLNDMRAIDGLMSGIPVVKSGVRSLDNVLIHAQNQYASVSRHAYVSGWWQIVVGICLSVAGTFLLKDEAIIPDRPMDDVLENDDKYDGFKM